MSSIYGKTKGFGKRMSGGTVMERKRARQKMVQVIVRNLKAEGKPVDRQAINEDVLRKCSRKH